MAAPISTKAAVLSVMTAPFSTKATVLSVMAAPVDAKAAVLRLIASVVGLTCAFLCVVSPCASLVAMSEPKKNAPLSVADDAIDDEEAPLSEARPSSPAADPAMLHGRGPSNDARAPLPPDDACFAATDAPSNDDAAALPVTRVLTNAFLAKKATQDRIREVIEYRVPRGTQECDVIDLVQQASLNAIQTTSLARSVEGMRPWVARIAQNTVIDHYRGAAKHLRWIDRAVDVQELPPDAATADDEAAMRVGDPTAAPRPVEEMDERMLGRWLDAHVTTKADRLTLEMLKQKGESGKTNAEIAAEYGITEGAYDQRVRRFKAEWVPAWQRYKRERRRAIVLLLLAAALAVGLWWLLHARKVRDEVVPAEGPVLDPAPTASAQRPEKLDQSLPREQAPPKAPLP
jgi:DNA-directed RNA polymerase specialized sigma24 family protein